MCRDLHLINKKILKLKKGRRRRGEASLVFDVDDDDEMADYEGIAKLDENDEIFLNNT